MMIALTMRILAQTGLRALHSGSVYTGTTNQLLRRYFSKEHKIWRSLMMYSTTGSLPHNEAEASTMRAYYLRALFSRWSR